MNRQEMEQEITTCVRKWVDYSHTVFSPNEWISMPNLVFVEKMRKATSAATANHVFHTLTFSLPVYVANRNQEFLDTVVAHEVAHLIAHLYRRNHFPFEKFTGHGRIWKDVMRRMGREPVATMPSGRFEFPEIVLRKRPYVYNCECKNFHHVSPVVHRRILKGKEYTCNLCKKPLVFKEKT